MNGPEHTPPTTVSCHVWLDPVLAMEMVKKIEKVLEEADPQGVEAYRHEELTQDMTNSLKPFVTFCVTTPGLPSPTGLPSISITGIISAPVPVIKHSSAL